MSFEHLVTVRFHHVDRAGIAFFGRAFEYAHTAFEELLSHTDESLTSVFDHGGWGMPLVHVEGDFKRPMRMGDRLRVVIGVKTLGERSITFAFSIFGADDGTLRATIEHVHAFVELENFTGRSIPDTLLTGLRKMGMLDESSFPSD